MTMQRITYDGMEWPLETFLDAYGFMKLDWRNFAHDPSRLCDLSLEVVVPEGSALTVRQMCGRHVDWHDTIAIRGADGLNMCEGCGLPFDPEPPIYASDVETRRRFVVNSFEAEYCDECQMDGEWDW